MTLLPTGPNDSTVVDGAYKTEVQQLAATSPWAAEDLERLAATTPQQQSALAQLILDGSDYEVRLAAVLGAGAPSSSSLGVACWKRAALDFNEARSLACLLAPGPPDTSALPILAWIARDARRSLAIRAAAVARLLDADCLAAWPTCRLMLLSGTAADNVTQLANWPRKGRYELPKRILVLSLQKFLLRHQLEPGQFEPNAAWQAQVRQVTKLDQILMSLSPPAAEQDFPASWFALKKLGKAGSEMAATSFTLFRYRAANFLNKL